MSNPDRYFPENQVLLGDKAYPVLLWLIPPYIDRGNLNAVHRRFNEALAKSRQVIERSFALLKGRFRRLKYLDMNRRFNTSNNFGCMRHTQHVHRSWRYEY